MVHIDILIPIAIEQFLNKIIPNITGVPLLSICPETVKPERKLISGYRKH